MPSLAWDGSVSRRESTSTCAPAPSTSRPPWLGGPDFGAALPRPTSRGPCWSRAGISPIGWTPSPRMPSICRLPAGQFDGAMIGWGVRNLVDLDSGLAEAARVLKPGARLVILEMAVPEQPLLRSGFQLYFRRIMPWIGRLISKHTTAYSWLPESARVFPRPAELARRTERPGVCRRRVQAVPGRGVCDACWDKNVKSEK